jgi:hypothetical protein
MSERYRMKLSTKEEAEDLEDNFFFKLDPLCPL